MPNFPERVAAKAVDIRVARILLTILAAPFYVVGFVAGVLWLALRWVFAALVVGFTDITNREQVTDDAG